MVLAKNFRSGVLFREIIYMAEVPHEWFTWQCSEVPNAECGAH